jgi:dienelactone hydrolase
VKLLGSILGMAYFAVAAFSQTLPGPTGTFEIGTTILHLTDRGRPDVVSKQPGDHRELMTQLWYPAASTRSTAKRATYLPEPSILKTLLDQQYDLQEEGVIRKLSSVETSAAVDVPPLKGSAKFPLLILSPGLGEPRSNYTAIAQELASHGYIVVTVDHPYGGFTILPDGRVITTDSDPRGSTPEGAETLTEEWAADASFIVTALLRSRGVLTPRAHAVAVRIDTKRIGMLGHSLGGAAALEACTIDRRFVACADLDGAPFARVTQTGIRTPTLVMRNSPIYSDADLAKKGRTREQWEQMGREGKKKWDTIVPRNSSTHLYTVRIAGSGHLSFSDAFFTMPDTISRFGGKIIDNRRFFTIMSSYLLDFFDHYLLGTPSRLLEKPGSQFPEGPVERIN